MFNLTKEEKLILVFLIFSFAVGIGAVTYNKSRQSLQLKFTPSQAEQLKKLDQLIEKTHTVNINSFELEELKKLPGVGEKLAQRIIDYHNLNGPFIKKEQLMEVKGIGKKKFKQINPLIVLE